MVSVVNCSLLSPGCLTLQAARTQPAIVASTSSRHSSGKTLLAWDPLLSSGMLRGGSNISGLSTSSSTVPGRRSTLPLRSSAARARPPRASSSRDEDEVQTEQVSDQESGVNVEQTNAFKNVLGNMLTTAAKPALVAVMMALLLGQPTEDAFAASSGGRIGGKAFSRPSAPPSRSYSGGGGGGGGGGRAYSGGGGGVYAAPPLYGSPYGFSPFGYSPFYGGGYGGGGLFLGPSIGFGGGGTIILAMIAFATLKSVLGFIRDRFGGDQEDDDRFDD